MAESSKSFYLQWDKFSSTCCGTFRNLLNSEEYSDVTLYCQGKFIKCHRIILSASSQFFKTLLQNVGQSNPIVAVPNIELCDLEALITFIYTGEVTVACNQLDSLVKIGELLKVNGLGDEETKAPNNPAETECRKPKRRKTESVDSSYSQSGVLLADTPVFEEIKQENMEMSNETKIENTDAGNEEYDETELDNLVETDMNASTLESCPEEDGNYFESGAAGSIHFTDVEKENGCGEERERILNIMSQQTGEKVYAKTLANITGKHCFICNKVMHSYNVRRLDHFVIHHPDVTKTVVLKCPACYYKTRSYRAFATHVSRKHSDFGKPVSPVLIDVERPIIAEAM